MHRLYTLKTVKKILWAGCLAVALLLFMQGLHAHVHTYDHDPATADHVHLNPVHLSHLAGGEGHPDESAPIDLATDGIVKQLSSNPLVAALLAIVIVLLYRFPVLQPPVRRETRVPIVSRRAPPPPPRAPPL